MASGTRVKNSVPVSRKSVLIITYVLYIAVDRPIQPLDLHSTCGVPSDDSFNTRPYTCAQSLLQHAIPIGSLNACKHCNLSALPPRVHFILKPKRYVIVMRDGRVQTHAYSKVAPYSRVTSITLSTQTYSRGRTSGNFATWQCPHSNDGEGENQVRPIVAQLHNLHIIRVLSRWTQGNRSRTRVC